MQFLQKVAFGQIGLFVLVGAANTLVDFGIYNVLTGRAFRWPRIGANLVSTTVAMLVSFSLNILFVFPPEDFSLVERAMKFLIVTISSLYLVQNAVIYLTTNVWVFPVKVALAIAKGLPVLQHWSQEFIGRNMVKLLATGCSLIWNFLWYKLYVFR